LSAVSADRLVLDQELLPIRVLAEELTVNPNTVARAYRELEAAGWVYKKRGAGTFVSDQHSALSAEFCNKQIRDRVKSLLTEAKHMNISIREIIQIINEVSKEFPEEPSS